jgi:hypothetical protein
MKEAQEIAAAMRNTSEAFAKYEQCLDINDLPGAVQHLESAIGAMSTGIDSLQAWLGFVRANLVLLKQAANHSNAFVA